MRGTYWDDLKVILSGLDKLVFHLHIDANKSSFPPPRTVDELWPEWLKGTMKAIMRHASHLKHFEVEVNEPSWPSLSRKHSKGINWPRLSTLNLIGVSIEERSFWDFLKRHNVPLEDINLNSHLLRTLEEPPKHDTSDISKSEALLYILHLVEINTGF